jgi:hypothetical protein
MLLFLGMKNLEGERRLYGITTREESKKAAHHLGVFEPWTSSKQSENSSMVAAMRPAF